jgi:hypothetical protein
VVRRVIAGLLGAGLVAALLVTGLLGAGLVIASLLGAGLVAALLVARLAVAGLAIARLAVAGLVVADLFAAGLVVADLFAADFLAGDLSAGLRAAGLAAILPAARTGATRCFGADAVLFGLAVLCGARFTAPGCHVRRVLSATFPPGNTLAHRGAARVHCAAANTCRSLAA